MTCYWYQEFICSGLSMTRDLIQLQFQYAQIHHLQANGHICMMYMIAEDLQKLDNVGRTFDYNTWR